MCININRENGPYFRTHMGLRHGDPLSPLLFNLAADASAGILDKAKQKGLVKDAIPQFQGALHISRMLMTLS